jgi:amidohydrolase family protein
MSIYDVILRGGTLVTDDGLQEADLAVADGRIADISPELEGAAGEEVDASGLHVFPGAIDAHAHFNEPGRTHWEGFATGTRALAAGGMTAYVEMPLNAHPPTCEADSFDLKFAAAETSSLVDFALWGGLVPGNVARLYELAERGVVGFKAFMSNSGIEDFEAADDLTLFEGMQRAAELGLPVLVHAENYEFEPFLSDVVQVYPKASPDGPLDVSDIDTVVVPAQDEGFEQVFMGEDRWYKVRIHGSMIPKLKYAAVYRVAPTSAIIHVAPISSIEPWQDTDKKVINFAEPAQKVGPIKLVSKG